MLKAPEPNNFSCIHRPEPNVMPDLPLPFCLRSAGHYLRLKKYYERIPAGAKPFVQFFWGISGDGEFIVDGESQILHPGDVFYRMPGEPHFQGALSERWEYRWFTFDGEGAENFMRSYGYPHRCFHAGVCPHELFIRLEELLQEMSPYAWREMVSVASSILARAGGREDRSTREGRLVCEVIRICSENCGDPDLNVNSIAQGEPFHSAAHLSGENEDCPEPVSEPDADSARPVSAPGDHSSGFGSGERVRLYRRKLFFPRDPAQCGRYSETFPGTRLTFLRFRSFCVCARESPGRCRVFPPLSEAKARWR